MNASEKVLPDDVLEAAAEHFGGRYPAELHTYGTARDLDESRRWFGEFATYNGDSKDMQRCWALKSILGLVPRGARICEFGAGEPFVAGALARLGYRPTVFDPYDGRDRGPAAFEHFVETYPDVELIRSEFPPQELEPMAAVYSISVLEHIPSELLGRVLGAAREMTQMARGWSIHAIDHTLAGHDAEQHVAGLHRICSHLGIPVALIDDLCARANIDPDTYLVSAEAQNGWRAVLDYDHQPQRRIISVNICDRGAGDRIGLSPAVPGPGHGERATDDGESRIPYPPFELMARVGGISESDPEADYEALGARQVELIESLLPEPVELGGGPTLDFGCGAGRLLRHLLPAADTQKICGAEIDQRSVEWLEANLSPPLEVVRSGVSPPLPWADGQFDLIIAASVFTHLGSTWAEWLLEMHRLLAPGGILVASTLSRGITEAVVGERFDEDSVGMNVVRHWQNWDFGGPSVIHSGWWLRAHWGRAFDLIEINDLGADGSKEQRWASWRRNDAPAPSPDELRRLEPGEPREVAALQRQDELLRSEIDLIVSGQVLPNGVMPGTPAHKPG